jgi:hypothetical protein
VEGAASLATHRSVDARALKARAANAYRNGDLHEAKRAAEAWALHDGTVEPRLFLATVLDAAGHRHEARVVLEEWLETHPDSAEARAMHARLGAPLPDPARKPVARR